TAPRRSSGRATASPTSSGTSTPTAPSPEPSQASAWMSPVHPPPTAPWSNCGPATAAATSNGPSERHSALKPSREIHNGARPARAGRAPSAEHAAHAMPPQPREIRRRSHRRLDEHHLSPTVAGCRKRDRVRSEPGLLQPDRLDVLTEPAHQNTYTVAATRVSAEDAALDLATVVLERVVQMDRGRLGGGLRVAVPDRPVDGGVLLDRAFGVAAGGAVQS